MLLIEDIRSALAAARAGGATLLDIGAGIGAIHHELLNDRVSTAIHVDASTAHMAAAREETDRRGHTGRVAFTYGDFVTVADTIPEADVVTLDRVLCCFDDMPQLVDLSARKARQFYAAVYPRDVTWMRIALGVLNFVQRVKGTTFRVFLHDPQSIHAALEHAGLTRRNIRHTLGWEVVVYERFERVG